MCNKYPLHVIESIVGRTLGFKLSSPEQVATVPKLRQYISSPFYGPSSYKVRSEIQTILKGVIPNVDFTFTIGSVFSVEKENTM